MNSLAAQLEARLREELARADAMDTHGANASLDAALEAEAIEKAAKLLIEHEDTRTDALALISGRWLWTRFPGLNEPAIRANPASTATYWTRFPGLSPEHEWPAGIDQADVAEWFMDGRVRASEKAIWLSATETHGVELVVWAGTPP